ncbi:MAG TPA: carboxypeptidase-like regulatory domain-containing protein [Kofleriaceae bacterium]|jgi:hypothetical protein|nr:carboxypeptidase-like regulatory domain-containing protein [Kofleriaceae bacterium]
MTWLARLVVLSGLLFAACSGGGGGETVDAMGGDATPDAPTMFAFDYTPSWGGVQTVEVFGAFGQATDWTMPFMTLTAAAGGYTGTAMLSPGPHPYILHVVGDGDAGGRAATLSRYAVDPASVAVTSCPAGPSYSATAMNPCAVAQLGPTAPRQHIHGRVVKAGVGVAGFLVSLDRAETGYGSYFVDRVTTGADGTYDFQAAAGAYRLIVQHPQFESSNDAQLSPDTLGIVRQIQTNAFTVEGEAGIALSDAEVGFPDYAKLMPRTTGTLPTTFMFGNSTDATQLQVYGTAKAGTGDEIGSAWFVSAAVKNGSAIFDGTFTTAQATETVVAKGERYFWGIQRAAPADVNGIIWTTQSLVYPLTWN